MHILWGGVVYLTLPCTESVVELLVWCMCLWLPESHCKVSSTTLTSYSGAQTHKVWGTYTYIYIYSLKKDNAVNVYVFYRIVMRSYIVRRELEGWKRGHRPPYTRLPSSATWSRHTSSGRGEGSLVSLPLTSVHSLEDQPLAHKAREWLVLIFSLTVCLCVLVIMTFFPITITGLLYGGL